MPGGSERPRVRVPRPAASEPIERVTPRRENAPSDVPPPPHRLSAAPVRARRHRRGLPPGGTRVVPPPLPRWPDRPAGRDGWPLIAAGLDTLIAAPTGSGKTLAAFLVGIDRLYRAHDAGHDIAARHPGRLRLAAQGAGRRHRREPRAAARRDRRGRRRARPAAAPDLTRRRAHRRHAAAPSAAAMLRRPPTSWSPRPSRSTCWSPASRGAKRCARSRR